MAAAAAGLLALGGCDPYRAGRAALLAGNPAAAVRELRPRDPRGYLLRAAAHLAAGAPVAAAADAEAALALRPRPRVAAEAWTTLARAERAAGHKARALAAYARVAEARPGCCGAEPELGELLVERARERLALGDAAGARRDAAAAARLGPAPAAVAASLLAAVPPVGPPPAAAATCAAAVGPDVPACTALAARAPAGFARVALDRGWTITRPGLVRALVADESFAPGELDALLDPGLALAEPAPAAPLVQAALLRLAGRLDEARGALDRALDAAPGDPELRRRLGREALLFGDLAAADRHLRWAEALGGGGPEAAAGRALLLRLGGDAPGEWRKLHDAAAGAPGPGPALAALGEHLVARGDLGPAAVALRASAALGHAPARVAEARVLEALAVLWLTLERPGAETVRARLVAGWAEVLGPEPAAELARAIAGQLETREPLARARVRLAAGDAAGAAAALGAVPGGTPAGPDAAAPACVPAAPPPFPRRDEPGWLLRARVAQASGDRAALVRVLGDAIDRPATRACRYPAAIALLEQEGARDEALGLARAFAAEDPARPAALLAVGRLELATGDDPAAALDFEGFVYHSVDRAAAFGEVARALDAGGRTRAACVTRRRAVAMRGGADPPTLLALGACLARDRQAPAADEVLARYLRLSPPAERARARREIVAAWSRAGDVARARAAAGDDPAAPVHLEGAAVPVALRALEAAAPRRPLDATLFARRAELHAAAGQADRALALLGRARAIRPDHPVVLATAARLLPGLTGPDAEPALLALALTGSAVVRCEADLGLARLYRDQRHAALAAAARRRLAACHDPDVRARAAALDAGAPAAR